MALDPRTFYNTTMPAKLGGDYERARWHSNAFVEAQYAMMVDVIHRLVAPYMRKATKIVEVGPGAGTWTKELLRENKDAQYTLVDISEEMLNRARSALGSRENINYVESDLLACEDGAYDFFFSSRAIEYMPNKEAAVQRIAGLLMTGAYGVIITKTPKTLFRRLKGEQAAEFHTGQISPHRLAALLRAAGLQVMTVRMATATVPLLRSPLMNSMCFRLFARIPLRFPLTFLSESYIVSFRKYDN